MMKKLIFITFGFLALIATLGLIAMWLTPDLARPEILENLTQEFQEVSSSDEEPNKEIIFQEFSSPDADFQMIYPVTWTLMNNKSVLQTAVPPDWAEEYGLKAVFLAQSFENGGFGQLIVYTGTFDMSPEEIFAKMKQTNQDNGWTVETINLQTSSNEGIFEGKYVNAMGNYLYAKEKILMEGGKTYWVAFFCLEENWLENESTIDKILNSATIKLPET